MSAWATGLQESAYEIFKLPSSLLNDTVLSFEDDTHSRKIPDLRLAHDKRVWTLA